MGRIDWSFDGRRLLACQRGAIRVLDDLGAPLRELEAGVYLDARWLAGGGVVAMHGDGVPRHFTMHGEPYARVEAGSQRSYYEEVAISARGTECAVLMRGDVHVYEMGGEQRTLWHSGRAWELAPSGRIDGAALSADGELIALSFRPRRSEVRGAEAGATRGWVVLDMERLRSGDRPWSPPPESVVDRSRYAVAREAGPLRFAFDRAGRRLAIAAPEAAEDGGVIRLRRGGEYPRRGGGGARCVALDDRGRLAAYGFEDGRVRVAYLDPQGKGGAAVDVLDQMWLEAGAAAVEAVAFDRESQRIACLGADGAVRVLPVP